MRMEPTGCERNTFESALRLLTDAGIRFVIAGAYAMFHYTGIWRNTKDMDVFLLQQDVTKASDLLAAHGFRTWCEADYWIAKATKQDCLVDLIFGSGNWLQPVDEVWFERGEPAELFGIPILMAAVEEVIWSKAYVAVRHRYDGADICHLLEARAERLDWEHLLDRFGPHWELLYSYLMLFRFAYPSRRTAMPDWVMRELVTRLENQLAQPAPTERICRGTLIDRFGFLVDVQEKGYVDPRETIATERGYDVGAVYEDRRAAEEFLRHQQPT